MDIKIIYIRETVYPCVNVNVCQYFFKAFKSPFWLNQIILNRPSVWQSNVLMFVFNKSQFETLNYE